VRISAKTDYAVRAVAELAAAPPGEPVKAERVATAQGIPLNFLENILGELRVANVVQSRRGPEGGFLLARPAAEISIADVIRAVDGPLAAVSGERPQNLEYSGPAAPLREVWIAVRANLRAILEEVTLADLANGRLPEHVARLTRDEDAWLTR
jgi:Rrf2 family protein